MFFNYQIIIDRILDIIEVIYLTTPWRLMQGRNREETRKASRADQGVWGAMADQGTQVAMADRETRGAMADQGIQEAMVDPPLSPLARPLWLLIYTPLPIFLEKIRSLKGQRDSGGAQEEQALEGALEERGWLGPVETQETQEAEEGWTGPAETWETLEVKEGWTGPAETWETLEAEEGWTEPAET